jgi:hypothetical protein
LPCERRRDDAVEHVHAERNRLEDVDRRAHPHQVAWPILGQEPGRERDEVCPLATRVAHRQPSDGEAVEGVTGQELRRLPAQRRRETALHDREEGLLGILPRRERPQRPPVRAIHGLPQRPGGLGRGQANVEDHHQVGAERRLHLDRSLRCEVVVATVHVALEPCALLGERALGGEREDLESPGVGEDGAVPAHEAVEPAEATDGFRARAQQEVVGVAEHDLGAEPRHVLGREPGDGPPRPHRHEGGGLHPAVPGEERAAPGAAPGIARAAVEREGHAGERFYPKCATSTRSTGHRVGSSLPSPDP